MSVLEKLKICLSIVLIEVLLFFRHRMSHQQLVINGTGPNGGTMHTLQHYRVNTPVQLNTNVCVRSVKQEQAQQSFMINRQFVQQMPNVKVQTIPQHLQAVTQHLQAVTQHMQDNYWLVVEIVSNNGLDSYAMVESKDVDQQPKFESLDTGKTIDAYINGKKTSVSVVLVSRKHHDSPPHETIF